MVAKIPVKDSQADLMLSFCMRQSTADNEWANKDGGDHYVTIPAGQSLVKAVFTQGEGITEVLPYNAGYEMDGANDTIHFYYRNDTLAAENNLASLDGKVSVVVNGQTCAMTYDAANDRFGYDFTGVSTGDYYYYYVVDGTEELDAFNSEKADYSGKECSVCHFKKANVSVEASLSQYAMDYNDNNVLSVKLTAKDGEGLETSEIAAITADLSELGLNREFAIDPTLMEGTISCLNTVAAGVKNIPVTVKDIYGNVYTTATNVTVTERKKSAGDFDWDEAVIYFAVTDRFFDGDASNNDAYGVGDYNVSEKGGSSYHGGDFAGLNQKLDYLKDLGVNTIWITPIVENITEDQHDNETDTATYGYHGYWASDFTKLNKHLGTEPGGQKMGQPITDYAAFFASAGQAVQELEALNTEVEQLEADEKKLESSLKGKQRSVTETISQTVKQRKEEITKSYDAELGKAQERLKKVKAKREKAKNQGVKERIEEDTRGLVRENKELADQIKTLFKANHVPGFCRGNYYYALYFTRTFKDFLALLVTILICFLPMLSRERLEFQISCTHLPRKMR